jgi:hypothetical protein
MTPETDVMISKIFPLENVAKKLALLLKLLLVFAKI